MIKKSLGWLGGRALPSVAVLVLVSACGGAAQEPNSAGSGDPASNPPRFDIDTTGVEKPDIGSYEAASADAPSVERDQAAILAMAGTFKVQFSFEEIQSLRPGYELKKPYLEKALELVEVVENTPGRVVLQHILLTGDDGKAHVIKHWRQDWVYEDTKILTFVGKDTWENVELPAEKVKGTWSQAVYNVDDSPRYEGIGRWTHRGKSAYWESEETWRPLPRREYTKRSDYHVIVAKNRHELTPGGWVHNQENQKLDIDDKSGHPLIVRELGVNTYDRTTEGDFTPGRAFWQQHQEFFKDVRAAWDTVLSSQKTVALELNPGGVPLWMKLLQLAKAQKGPYTPGSQLAELTTLLQGSVKNSAATSDDAGRSASR